MRCDRCKQQDELTPVTLGKLNEGYQFDGYVDDAETVDLCDACIDKVRDLWNSLVHELTPTEERQT